MVRERGFGIWCNWLAESSEKRGFLEQGEAEDLQNFVEAAVNPQFLFHNGHKDIHADGNPDLGFHRVVAGAVKGFDSQMLFDPFEEQFDLPAALVEPGDRERWEGEVVRQEHEAALVFGIVEDDAAERIGIQPRRLGSLPRVTKKALPWVKR